MRRLAVSLAVVALSSLLGAASAFAAAPTIPYVGVSEATTDSITLEADINPQGKGVNWHFEYGPADCASNPCTSVPSKDKVITAGTAPVRVAEPISGLAPGTTYHYRVVAKNGAKETAESPDRPFATFSLPQVFEPCPNDALRKGAGALLPDCRAYEQASPVSKNGGDVTNYVPFVAASESGDAVTFLSDAGVPDGEGSQELPLYLASRGPGGWTTQGLLPHAKTGQRARVLGWLSDFSRVYDRATMLGDPLMTTFLARSSADSSLTTISPYLPAAVYQFVGASSDGSTVLYETGLSNDGADLIGKSKLYAWDRDSGDLRLAGVFNDGEEPAKGAFAGSYDWVRGTTPRTLSEGGAFRDYYTQDQNAVSADGSVVYFTASGTGLLYARHNPTEEQSPVDKDGKCLDSDLACTIRVNTSQKTNGEIPGGTDPAGIRPAAFQGATPDGTKSFFTSTEMLTDDANTGPEQDPAAIARADVDGKPESVKPTFIPTHASSVAKNDTHIYWVETEKETIARAELDGSKVEDEYIGADFTSNPEGLAVDDEYVYWTNYTDRLTGNGTIARAKIGASGPEEIKLDFITGATGPQAVTVNDTHVYWTSRYDPSLFQFERKAFIGRAELDGDNPEPEFIEAYGPPRELPGIAVDAAHIYWTYIEPSGFGGAISRAKLDGTDYIELGVNNIVFIYPGIETDLQGLAATGSHIFWASRAKNLIGRATLNGDGKASEIELEFIKSAIKPQGVAADSSHIYWGANADAAPNPGNDLYRYDAETDELIDLSVDTANPNGAEVRGVLGVSDDGSRVYFVANGDLDGAGQGNCSGDVLSGNGLCNLYLWHEGEIRFIAKLDPAGEVDGANWAATPTGVFPSAKFQKTSRVTADGRTLLFLSQRKLTAYDNEGIAQLYRYDADDESIVCVTCNPTGEAPTSEPTFTTISPTALIPSRPASVPTAILSDDGKRVFFETTEALVQADTNAEGGCPVLGGYLTRFPVCRDVYEWEAEGKGSCEKPGGCHYLLSTGTDEQASHFAGMSASGDDAFIYTRSRLVGQDTDSLRDVYAVSVGGGLASQYPKPKAVCEGEACKPQTSTPPPSQSAGTAAFAGPPNPKPNRKKARHKRKKQRKQAQRKRAHRRAQADRRAKR